MQKQRSAFHTVSSEPGHADRRVCNTNVNTYGLKFIDYLSTAVAKDFNLQAKPRVNSHLNPDISARYTEDSNAGLALTGDAFSGKDAIGGNPGAIVPWTVASRPL